MINLKFDKENTALVVIDPYNDFISEGGKVWDRLKGVAEANQCVPHMVQVLDAARRAGIRVFYALHRRYRAGDYATWKYVAPIQQAAWNRKTFEYGTWGAEIRSELKPAPGDVVAAEHWCSSGFANTDLDLQLKEHGIHRLIVTGLIAHTCVEATVRFAVELGYDVTVVKDATASYSEEHMHAALVVNMPNYASAILTADEIVAVISEHADESLLRCMILGCSDGHFRTVGGPKGKGSTSISWSRGALVMESIGTCSGCTCKRCELAHTISGGKIFGCQITSAPVIAHDSNVVSKARLFGVRRTLAAP